MAYTCYPRSGKIDRQKEFWDLMVNQSSLIAELHVLVRNLVSKNKVDSS